MPFPGSRYFAIATALLAVLVSPCGSPGADGQTNDKTSAIKAQNEAPFQLKAASNLVVVRVVVRDAQGKPVENLKKEDFKLFDRGKEQSIAQFEEETSARSSTAAIRAQGKAAAPLPPALPGKFIAFYFDDLNTSDADMIQARDAADRYLAANLQPHDQVAIFTSKEMLSDFTADPKQIYDALFKLFFHVFQSGRAPTRIHECPDLSDSQALEITENELDQTIDAWTMALDEAVNRCHMPMPKYLPGVAQAMPGATVEAVRNLARTIVAQSEMQARTSLYGLEQVVNIVSRAPGQRSIILVSPGFLSQSEQYMLDRIIDRALRSEVVISSLDPKGLAILMREGDASQNYAPSASTIAAADNTNSAREADATEVLAEIAHGTGGEFFHNNNDLKAGFGALAGSPAYYILAFAPTHMKPDGKFHALKVTLADRVKGFTIQSRRGYFAVKNEGGIAPESTEAKQSGAQEMGASHAETQAQEQIPEAVPSRTEIAQFPVGLDTKLADGQDEARGSQTQPVVCSGGFGSFDSESTTGLTVSVGAARNGEFAARACQAKLSWDKQDLLVEPVAWKVDVDAMGVDLGVGSLVVALQVKTTKVDPLMKYEVYSLQKPPQQLRVITGGDFYSAADTDLDGRIEIWTDDAGAVNGFENLTLTALDFAPTVVLRFERRQLIDVSSEFQSHFDRQIAVVRAQLNAQQLSDFKNSDGKLSPLLPPSLDELRRLRATKIKVLEIVWGYLYSGREQDAWNALADMWPAADFDRIRTSMLNARAHGIRSEVDGVSHKLSPSHFKKKHAMIYDRVSNASPDGNLLSWDYAPGLSGPSKDKHTFEADTFPVQILLRRPAPPDASQAVLGTEVAVNLVIDAAGKVRSAKTEGKPDKPLIDATADWKFIPALKDGLPVASRLRLGVTPSR
jgi:VWFA-related protein